MYQLKVTVKIVNLLLSVRPLAAGSVKPNMEYFSVVCQKLGKLRLVINIIFIRAVKLGMSVPWRKVKPEFQSVAAACFGKLLYNVALAVPVRAFFHAVIGVFCLPKAKSVVMLCRNDNALHTCGFYSLAPTVTVKVNGIENRRILVTRAPFEICICVRTEMDESIKGRFGQKPKLICARLNMCRLLYEVLHFCPPLFKFYSTKYSRQSEPL